MRFALLIALLLLGTVDAAWWGDKLLPDGDPTESAEIRKMDGTEPPPPPPRP